MRLRLDLGYDGSAFSGWARQPGLRTVQGELESALATVLRGRDGVPDPPTLTVAGRTDAGVHAAHQVAHVDLSPAQWASLVGPRRGGHLAALTPEVALARRLNGLAGGAGDVVVRAVTRAPEGFDARFSAIWRRYEYRIADEAAERDPRRRNHTLWHSGVLDGEAMDAASRALTGLHDFAAFCKPRPGSTTIRTLLDYSWSRSDEGVLIGHVRADAFCHSMVRSLVGAAIAVGLGRIDADRVQEVRARAERSNDVAVVPAKGLTLAEIAYPADEELAARAAQTRARREPATSAGGASPAN
ncbi:tRNA pseudouridine synthase A [Microcella daejeonensis]|uniref:tRNA pseudouridine synthase A n=1 Tax=Microcella daejeonensis TaxID=2994971 RepID=A0A9E8SA56_9MICO|nr:tRNA pseudouridine synthase A [Microcella daejeonensis]WAB82729.1 tRNA pseudouridine synthase A [Microcella daejeonensis]